jgi:transcriptional regulator with XRE-family HTH domain
MRRLMTQEELARASGVSVVTIIRIESGQQDARLSTVRKLAGALEVDASEILAPVPEHEAKKSAA